MNHLRGSNYHYIKASFTAEAQRSRRDAQRGRRERQTEGKRGGSKANVLSLCLSISPFPYPSAFPLRNLCASAVKSLLFAKLNSPTAQKTCAPAVIAG